MAINCRGTSRVRKYGAHVHTGFDGTPVPSRPALNFPPDMLDVPLPERCHHLHLELYGGIVVLVSFPSYP